jgi:hypothetical protein
VQVAREPHAGERRGLVSLRLGAGERRALHFLELRARERRLAQRLGHEPQGRDEVLPAHLDARAFAAHADAGVQALEGVLELGAAALLRAAHQHRPGEIARRLPVHERAFVAPVQRERRHHPAAARLLRQQGDADSIGQLSVDGALVDVLRRRIERVAERYLKPANRVLGER